MLVPVANPDTENNLLQLAIILTKRVQGTLLPLHVLADGNGPISASSRMTQRQLLDTAEDIAHAANITVETVGRIDDSVAWGVIRASQERDADLLICGWKGFSTYRENFFGGVIDNIVRSATIPVLIARFPQPIKNTRRIMFALFGKQAQAADVETTLDVASTLAEELKAPLHLLHITTSAYHGNYLASLLEGKEVLLQQLQGNPIKCVSATLQPDDLLIIIASTYRRGQSVLGRLPELIVSANWDSNIIVMKFPVS